MLRVAPEWFENSRYPSGEVLATVTSTGWIANALLFDRIVNSLEGTTIPCILSVSWSLSYELQFYLVMGVYLVSKKLFWALVMLLSALSIWSTTQLHFGHIPLGYGLLTDGYWLYFLLGICCYQAGQSGARERSFAWTGYALTALVTTIFIWQPSSALGYLCITALVSQLIALHVRRDHGSAKALPGSVILRKLGEISYSLYLVHLPLSIAVPNLLALMGVRTFGSLLIASIVVVTVSSICVARLYYLLVERRFMQLRRPAPALPRGSSQLARE